MAASLERGQRELEGQNAQLRESERLRFELVSAVSHEVRTPLACVLGYTTLLLTREVVRKSAGSTWRSSPTRRGGSRRWSMTSSTRSASRKGGSCSTEELFDLSAVCAGAGGELRRAGAPSTSCTGSERVARCPRRSRPHGAGRRAISSRTPSSIRREGTTVEHRRAARERGRPRRRTRRRRRHPVPRTGLGSSRSSSAETRRRAVSGGVGLGLAISRGDRRGARRADGLRERPGPGCVVLVRAPPRPTSQRPLSRPVSERLCRRSASGALRPSSARAGPCRPPSRSRRRVRR